MPIKYLNKDGLTTLWGIIKAAVETLVEMVADKADKATTLSGYGITDGYTKTEVDTKIDGIRIGGRNILSNTSDEFEEVSITNKWGWLPTPLRYPSDKSEQPVTYRVYIKNPSDSGVILRAYLAFMNQSDQSYEPENDVSKVTAARIAPGEEGYSTITATTVANLASIARTIRVQKVGASADGAEDKIGTKFYIREEKLEFGNKATDWTPSLEDSDNRLIESKLLIQDNRLFIVCEAGAINLSTDRVVFARYTKAKARYHSQKHNWGRRKRIGWIVPKITLEDINGNKMHVELVQFEMVECNEIFVTYLSSSYGNNIKVYEIVLSADSPVYEQEITNAFFMASVDGISGYNCIQIPNLLNAKCGLFVERVGVRISEYLPFRVVGNKASMGNPTPALGRWK